MEPGQTFQSIVVWCGLEEMRQASEPHMMGLIACNGLIAYFFQRGLQIDFTYIIFLLIVVVFRGLWPSIRLHGSSAADHMNDFESLNQNTPLEGDDFLPNNYWLPVFVWGSNCSHVSMVEIMIYKLAYRDKFPWLDVMHAAIEMFSRWNYAIAHIRHFVLVQVSEILDGRSGFVAAAGLHPHYSIAAHLKRSLLIQT